MMMKRLFFFFNCSGESHYFVYQIANALSFYYHRQRLPLKRWKRIFNLLHFLFCQVIHRQNTAFELINLDCVGQIYLLNMISICIFSYLKCSSTRLSSNTNETETLSDLLIGEIRFLYNDKSCWKFEWIILGFSAIFYNKFKYREFTKISKFEI